MRLGCRKSTALQARGERVAARVPAKSPAAVRRPTAIWSLPAWLNRRTLIWALYDVAGSAYFGVVPVVLFPVLFTTVIAPGPNASLYWGLTVSAALLTAGLLSPFVGALADRTGTRWRLLVLATLASVVATASCYFLLPGQILLAAAVYVAAQGGYLIATSLYESYLPRIAAPGEGGRVSGFGWAVGFIGGIAAILAILTFTRGPAGLELGDSYRFGFVIVAVIFGVIAAAALFGLRRMGDTGHVSTRRGAWSTLRHWREHREIFKLILASYLINDGMVTIVAFSANFFRVNFGASMDRLLLLLLAYHVIALPATFAFGALADRWSHRKAIALSLSIWIGALLLMAFGDGDWVPFSVVALLAIVFGSTRRCSARSSPAWCRTGGRPNSSGSAHWRAACRRPSDLCSMASLPRSAVTSGSRSSRSSSSSSLVDSFWRRSGYPLR